MGNRDIDPDAFAGLNGGAQSADVAERTNGLIDGGSDTLGAVSAVAGLAASLPKLDDIVEVGEDDTSPLTESEKIQKGKTEEVILAASEAGRAAIWVMGQGFAAAAKGKWFRGDYSGLEEYMAALVPEVVPRQARRWVTGSKLALAITERTGEAPVEGQIRELTKAKGKEKKTLPEDLAEDMYVVLGSVASETGNRVTAKVVEEFREVVEDAELPEIPEERQRALDEWARALFVEPANPGPIGPGPFEDDSNKPEGVEGGDGVHVAEIVETPQLDALDQALADLRSARKTIKRPNFEAAIDEGDHERYRRLLNQLQDLTKELHGVAGRAPWPAVVLPAQAAASDSEGAESATA
ncbi:hypothetical protein ACIBEA_40310 [Streptomyces sp. NPDC051555]|uniref:hypothetical protein n=1 Tax=Streptomyces sp. NPDC051555 TaxID=3365657 RepID=UPI0037B758DE